MIELTHRTFKRAVSKMKKTIREEIEADFKQHAAEKAIVAGFGFDHFHQMMSSIPCNALWDGGACAHYLHGHGFLSKEDAEQSVDWLEEDLGWLLDHELGRSEGPDLEGQAQAA